MFSFSLCIEFLKCRNIHLIIRFMFENYLFFYIFIIILYIDNVKSAAEQSFFDKILNLVIFLLEKKTFSENCRLKRFIFK